MQIPHRLGGYGVGALTLLAMMGACSAEPLQVTTVVPQAELLGEGEAMAEVLCQSCHAITKTDTSSHPDAPAFRDLSKRYDLQTLYEPLAEGIMVGHPDMPEWKFEPRHVDAILTYIESVQVEE